MKKLLFLLLIIGFSMAPEAYALRLYSSGFELGSVTPGVEFYNVQGGPTIDTGTVRTGTYSLKSITDGLGGATSAGTVEQDVSTSDITGPIYVREYIYITTAPNVETAILYIGNSAGQVAAQITLVSGLPNTLNAKVESTSIGTTSITAGSWHRVELYGRRVDATAWALEARLDGTVFALTSLTASTKTFSYVRIGTVTTSFTSGEMYFDDWAINDGTGGVQNNFPGDGAIVHLKPNANGDSDECNEGVNGYLLVDEVTPDDGSTQCSLTSNGGGDTLDVNVQSATDLSIPTDSQIPVIQVGTRQSSATTSQNSGTLRIKSQANGIVQSQAVTRLNTTWDTHDDTRPRLYKLTSYVNPQNSQRWTTNLLTNMQIGVNANDANPDYYLSTLWALVEYTSPRDPSLSGVTVTTRKGWTKLLKGWTRIFPL